MALVPLRSRTLLIWGILQKPRWPPQQFEDLHCTLYRILIAYIQEVNVIPCKCICQAYNATLSVALFLFHKDILLLVYFQRAREEAQELKIQMDIITMECQSQKSKGNSLFSEVKSPEKEILVYVSPRYPNASLSLLRCKIA